MNGVVALYVRQSVYRGGDDDSLSLAAQEARLRDYAARNDLEVAGVFSDADVSGAAESRAGLDALLAAVRAGGITHVGVYSLSRLARDSYLFLRIVRELDTLRVQLVSTSESTEDRTITTVLAAFSERERIQISNNVAWAVRESARRGRMILPPPYGYQRVAGEVVPHPLHAPVVQRVFALYAAGKTLREIAAALDADGISSPEGLPGWRTTGLTRMLANPAYRGDIRINESRDPAGRVRPALVTPGTHPPLVDPTTWETVQRRKRDGSHPRKATGYPAPWLAGVSVCAACGARLYVELVRHKPVQPYWIFRCASHRRAAVVADAVACPGQPIAAYPALDAAARIALEADLAGSWTVDDAAARAHRIVGAGNTDRAATLRRIVQDASDRLSRAYDAYEAGDLPLPRYRERKADLEAKRDQALTELAALPVAPEPAALVPAHAAIVDAARAVRYMGDDALRALVTRFGATVALDLRDKTATWSYAEPYRWLLGRAPS